MGLFVDATAHGAEPAYDVCEAPVRADLSARFGQEIRFIKFTWTYDGKAVEHDFVSSAVVYPEGCDGYYWFELFATYDMCVLLPHYGTPP